MICKRCGSGSPDRPDGLCFHCTISVELENALSEQAGKPVTLKEAGIQEGFPEWRKPTKRDLK